MSLIPHLSLWIVDVNENKDLGL